MEDSRDFALQDLGPRSVDIVTDSIPSVLAAICGLVPQNAFTAQDLPQSPSARERKICFSLVQIDFHQGFHVDRVRDYAAH